MQKRGYWIPAILALTFVFRDYLGAMLPYQEHSISLAVVLVSLVGAIVIFSIGYLVVTGLNLREVTYVGGFITAGSIFCMYLGRWLAGFEVIGDFWGGFINGVFEAAVLYGALYGAKEVWSVKEK